MYRESLQYLNANSFALVLVGIMMPEMNGYQVLEQMKSTPSVSALFYAFQTLNVTRWPVSANER